MASGLSEVYISVLESGKYYQTGFSPQWGKYPIDGKVAGSCFFAKPRRRGASCPGRTEPDLWTT
jgi:hypothetical protein